MYGAKIAIYMYSYRLTDDIILVNTSHTNDVFSKSVDHTACVFAAVDIKSISMVKIVCYAL